jgi:hypothetical protein
LKNCQPLHCMLLFCLQALQSCNDRACAGGSLPLQRAMAVLGAGQGPVWTRQQAQGRESSVCRHLEQVRRVQVVACRRQCVPAVAACNLLARAHYGLGSRRRGAKAVFADTLNSSGMVVRSGGKVVVCRAGGSVFLLWLHVTCWPGPCMDMTAGTSARKQRLQTP